VDAGYKRDEAEQGFTLCGGKIRGVIKACKDYDAIKQVTDSWIRPPDASRVRFALESTMPTNDPTNPDSTQTMFRAVGDTYDKLMLATRKVDSVYIIECAGKKIHTSKFFRRVSQ
jgi:hypothetical protein